MFRRYADDVPKTARGSNFLPNLGAFCPTNCPLAVTPQSSNLRMPRFTRLASFFPHDSHFFSLSAGDGALPSPPEISSRRDRPNSCRFIRFIVESPSPSSSPLRHLSLRSQIPFISLSLRSRSIHPFFFCCFSTWLAFFFKTFLDHYINLFFSFRLSTRSITQTHTHTHNDIISSTLSFRCSHNVVVPPPLVPIGIAPGGLRLRLHPRRRIRRPDVVPRDIEADARQRRAAMGRDAAAGAGRSVDAAP